VPQVEFHSGVAAPAHFACRLLRKACRHGVAVAVAAPAQALAALDRELWTFEAQEFVPHLLVRVGQGVDDALRRTPVWLCEAGVPEPGPAVLLNLGASPPPDAARFERIIEIVSREPEQREQARQRWRDYQAQGWDIRHHAAAAR